jgi:hypothetical protein
VRWSRAFELGLVLIAWFVAAPVALGAATDCSALPTSALKPRACSPQQECLRLIPKDLQGPALEAARRDCQRQPASGICHGPERHNPRAACLAEQPQQKK